MYAVIFTAELKEIDRDYFETAARLRAIAETEFGCTAFTSSTEGNQEVSISYWPSQAHIQAWNEHPPHQEAQRRGKADWYNHYQIQVVEVLREYKDQPALSL